MKFCIMHFVSSLLRFFILKNFTSNNFLWSTIGAIQMLFSPSCSEFNSLQKKIYSIGPILFQKIKTYSRWSAEKQMVKFYLVPGVTYGKIYLVPNDSYEQFYFAVKGLTFWSFDKVTQEDIFPNFLLICVTQKCVWAQMG